jgi:hypothetical protein
VCWRCRPSHGELFAAPAEPGYITWEQDFAGMNNVRYQVRGTNTQLPGAGSCRSRRGSCCCSPRVVNPPQAVLRAAW